MRRRLFSTVLRALSALVLLASVAGCSRPDRSGGGTATTAGPPPAETAATTPAGQPAPMAPGSAAAPGAAAPPAAPGTAASPGEAADTGTAAILARFRSRLPDSLLVRRGACPFECCTYGEWTARTRFAVYASQDSTAQPLFTIPVGQRFRARTGEVRIRGIMLAVPIDTVAGFTPADTLVVLEPIGEGYFHVWHDGRVKEVPGFWGGSPPSPRAKVIGDSERQWWVHVALPDGRTGWILMGRNTSVGGADRCA